MSGPCLHHCLSMASSLNNGPHFLHVSENTFVLDILYIGLETQWVIFTQENVTAGFVRLLKRERERECWGEMSRRSTASN